jgi:hypothetical protein
MHKYGRQKLSHDEQILFYFIGKHTDIVKRDQLYKKLWPNGSQDGDQTAPDKDKHTDSRSSRFGKWWTDKWNRCNCCKKSTDVRQNAQLEIEPLNVS